MCKTKINAVTESGVLAAIAVVEEHLGMTSDEFRRAWSAGELDDSLFVLNHWDHLLDLLEMLRAEAQDEEIVAQTREIVALGQR